MSVARECVRCNRRYRDTNMLKATRRGLVLLIAGIWEAVNQWHLLDFVVAKLRSEGPVGMFLADLITSETFRLLLIITGLLIIAKGYIDDRKRVLDTPGGVNPLPVPLLPDASSAGRGTRLPKTRQRVFVGTKITPTYLNKLLEERTAIQAQAGSVDILDTW